MHLKLIFSVICAVSTFPLLAITFGNKSKQNYIKSIRNLMFSAVLAVLANILIANSSREHFANISYCLYFSELDWISYFLCMFCLEYTEHNNFLKKIKPAATVLCLLDSFFLYVNLVNKIIFDVYTSADRWGSSYYLYSAKPIYYVHLTLDYLLILIGIIALSISLCKSYGFYRKKYLSIILVVWFIILLNIIYMLFLIKLDFSVLFYAIAGILIYYYAYTYIPRHIKNQAFGLVLNYMNEGLVVFDKDRNCIFTNSMARDELGMTIENSGIDSPIVKKFINNNNIEEETFTEIYHTEDEPHRIYKIYYHNVFEKKHRTLGSFFIFENVTQEYEALHRMEEAQAEAENANKAKSMFLANMSHEIRTPINSVLGMNEMILREANDDAIIDYAQNIDSAGNALLALINDILDFSKIEAGKFELVDETYSFQKLIHDCFVMLLPRAEAKNLGFTFKIDENIPCKLRGDKQRVLQILINIISNAIKYTQSGSVTVTASYSQVSDSEIMLSVAVADTGIGISDEDKNKLFDAFVRAEQYKNRNIEGTGLGLAITKQLTEMMNGTITVDSEKNRGSVFTVNVVQKVVNYTPGGAFGTQTETESRATGESFTAPDAKILAVDDIKTNLKVITALLKRTQIQVDTAESGTEAISLCSEKKYDLILMDHMMPTPDGIETFKTIRNGDGPNKDTPQIILTANAISGASDEYISIGFDNYLSKPIKSNELEAMLMNYLPSELVIK